MPYSKHLAFLLVAFSASLACPSSAEESSLEKASWPAIPGTNRYRGKVTPPEQPPANFITPNTSILIPSESKITVRPEPKTPALTSPSLPKTSAPALPPELPITKEPYVPPVVEPEAPPPPPPPPPPVEEPSPLPENPGPAEIDLSLAITLGQETFTATGGLSDFESSALTPGAGIRFLGRTDPTQDIRWAVGSHLNLHTFTAEIETTTDTVLKNFYRFNGHVWLGYEFFAPTGRPESLLLGAGAAAGRLPGFTEANVRTGRGDMADHTWATALFHAEYSRHDTPVSGYGVSADIAMYSITTGTTRRYDLGAHWRPSFTTSILPEGWFSELAGHTSQERRSTPFSCLGQPQCVDPAVTTSVEYTGSLALGTNF